MISSDGLPRRPHPYTGLYCRPGVALSLAFIQVAVPRARLTDQYQATTHPLCSPDFLLGRTTRRYQGSNEKLAPNSGRPPANLSAFSQDRKHETIVFAIVARSQSNTGWLSTPLVLFSGSSCQLHAMQPARVPRKLHLKSCRGGSDRADHLDLRLNSAASIAARSDGLQVRLANRICLGRAARLRAWRASGQGSCRRREIPLC